MYWLIKIEIGWLNLFEKLLDDLLEKLKLRNNSLDKFLNSELLNV